MVECTVTLKYMVGISPYQTTTKHNKVQTICILFHYGDVIMAMIASQITGLTIVNSTVYSDADHRKHQSSASLAFVRGIHRGPVNSPHKWPVTLKKFPFDDVIMYSGVYSILCPYFLNNFSLSRDCIENSINPTNDINPIEWALRYASTARDMIWTTKAWNPIWKTMGPFY